MFLAFSVHPRTGLGPARFLGSSLLSGAKSHGLSSFLTMKPMSKTCKQADSKDACLCIERIHLIIYSCIERAQIENICKERTQNHCTRPSNLLFSLQWIPLVGAALLGAGRWPQAGLTRSGTLRAIFRERWLGGCQLGGASKGPITPDLRGCRKMPAECLLPLPCPQRMGRWW